MNRKDYERAMNQRRRRQAQRDAAHVAICPFNRPLPTGLYGGSFWAYEIVPLAYWIEHWGGSWLAFTSADLPNVDFKVISTVPFCGGSPCPIDHSELGRKLLADLEAFLVGHAATIRVTHGRDWTLTGSPASRLSNVRLRMGVHAE